MLNQREPAIDEVESKSGSETRINVPFLFCTKLSPAAVYQADEEEVEQTASERVAHEKSFEAHLQNLEQLTLVELHELRREIARHSHPDLEFRLGATGNYDLMSKANRLIDDEIKRRF